jgi:hypothetical protein
MNTASTFEACVFRKVLSAFSEGTRLFGCQLISFAHVYSISCRDGVAFLITIFEPSLLLNLSITFCLSSISSLSSSIALGELLALGLSTKISPYSFYYFRAYCGFSGSASMGYSS